MIKLSEIRGAIHLTFRERNGLLGVMLILAAIQSAKEYKKSWYQDPIPKDQLGQLFSFLEAHPITDEVPEDEAPKPRTYSYEKSERLIYPTENDKVEVESLSKKETVVPVLIELNSADSAMLTKIRGVGGWSARKVLRFREALGGFHSMEQLDEVYGLHEEVKEVLKRSILIDTLEVKRIDLDTCSAESLADHPYISWKLAKTMVAFREQHGPFEKVEDLKQCYLINDSIFARIKPYLNVAFQSDTRKDPESSESDSRLP